MRDRGDESGPVTFLFLGRLTEAKGVPFLLEVWRSGMPAGVELLIAGDGPLASNVAAAASADATIRVVGWADADMKAKLLTTSDVLLHPSESEVCSLSASEAFLSGLPVISTPDAASPYASDGDNGRIVDRDVVAWRAAIVDMTDPSILRSMQSGARATAPRIDWTSHVADLESTYRCVVRDHGRCHV
jgi:glycosyltransferase involved in cell wall biosynthesis